MNMFKKWPRSLPGRLRRGLRPATVAPAPPDVGAGWLPGDAPRSRPPVSMTVSTIAGREGAARDMSGTPHTPPTPPETTPSEPNRRQFLLSAVGGAALALPVAAMARARAAPISADAGPDWGQLERVLKGKLLR